MNLFQWLTVPALCVLMSIDLFRCFQKGKRPRLVRAAVCLIAASLILYPSAATTLAQQLGIGRGTDLVVYAFMLAATAVLLHLYGRQFTLRRELVALARREALREPIAGDGLSRDATFPQSSSAGNGGPQVSE